jgi:hypothetical protein
MTIKLLLNILGTTSLPFGDISGPAHKAIFEFGPTLSNSTIPSGSIALEATFQINGGK